MKTIPTGITLVILLGYEKLSLELVAGMLQSQLKHSVLVNVSQLIERQSAPDTVENRKHLFEKKLSEVASEGIEFFIVIGFPTDIETSIEVERIFGGNVITFFGTSTVYTVNGRRPLSRLQKETVRKEIEKYDNDTKGLIEHLSSRGRGCHGIPSSRIEAVQAQFIRHSIRPHIKTAAAS